MSGKYRRRWLRGVVELNGFSASLPPAILRPPREVAVVRLLGGLFAERDGTGYDDSCFAESAEEARGEWTRSLSAYRVYLETGIALLEEAESKEAEKFGAFPFWVTGLTGRLRSRFPGSDFNVDVSPIVRVQVGNGHAWSDTSISVRAKLTADSPASLLLRKSRPNGAGIEDWMLIEKEICSEVSGWLQGVQA